MTSFEEILLAVIGYLALSVSLGALVGRHLRGPVREPDFSDDLSSSIDESLAKPELLLEA